MLLHNLKKYNAEKNFKTKDKKFYNSIIQLDPLTATLLKVKLVAKPNTNTEMHPIVLNKSEIAIPIHLLLLLRRPV